MIISTIEQVKEAGAVFWVRTPTGLVMRNEITPEEYAKVHSIEYGNSDVGKYVELIENKKENK